MINNVMNFFLTKLPFLVASQDEWTLAAIIAAALYAILAVYLVSTSHVTLESTETRSFTFLGIKVNFAVCIDKRDKGKYRVPGGAGTFAIGLTAWLAYVYVFPGWDWLVTLARIQFLMSALDTIILWIQFLIHFGPEIVIVESHSLRHPGCGRTSATDPIGVFLYVAQIIIERKTGSACLPLRYLRGIWQFFLYDIIGSILTPVVNIPALLFGKVVIGWPL